MNLLTVGLRSRRSLVALLIAVSASIAAAIAPIAARAESGTGCNQAFGQMPFPGDPRVVSINVGGPVKVLLPSDYDTSGRRYPVLYLLHGAQGNEDSWLNFSDILGFTAPFTGNQAAIVVMPAGDELGGGMIDWRNGLHQWEANLTDQLIPYVDTHFRTFADRAHRAIAGLSAGGLSTMSIAARHPQLFVAAGSFSGELDTTNPSPYSESFAYAAQLAENTCEGGPAGTTAANGDPITDDIWWHNDNPPDLAPNFGGITTYAAAGNGQPCDLQDVETMVIPFADVEPAAHGGTQDWDAALTAAGVPHTTDLYGCGIHWWRYWQRDLHVFWPIMLDAFGTPAPKSFSYRRADPDFTVWDWSFKADAGRAAEFLDLSHVSKGGLTLTGSGTETVTTAPLFSPSQVVQLTGAQQSTATADAQGRITFTVDLGPPDTHQQYAPGSPNPTLTTRAVTFQT